MYYRRKKFLYPGFRRLLNLKYSFAFSFMNIFVLLESILLKNSLYITSSVFSLCELIGKKFTASA